MAVYATVVISDQVFLRDVDDNFKKLEGECTEEERAWVTVRQATEEDAVRCLRTIPDRQIELTLDGRQLELVSDDVSELKVMEIYSTLVDTGGIYDHPKTKKSLFRFEKGDDYQEIAMPYDEFKSALRGLHTTIVNAMLVAVWDHNPQWDMRRRAAATEDKDNGSGEAAGGEKPPSKAT